MLASTESRPSKVSRDAHSVSRVPTLAAPADEAALAPKHASTTRPVWRHVLRGGKQNTAELVAANL
eukprot:2184515-Alexandrium_andersonii.AAC.1